MLRRPSILRLEELESRLLLKGPSDAPPLGPPPSPGPSVIWVDTVAELQAAVNNLQNGQTVVIQRGTYALTQTLYVGNGHQVANATIRGETDNPADVVIVGKGMNNASFGAVPMGFSFYNAQDVTLANVSIGDVWYHPIEIKGDAGADRINLYHLRVYDGGEQLIKSNPGTNDGADDVKVEYCTIEYTTGPSMVDHGGGTGYTNGMSVHTGDNWIIRHNLFRNFHTPDNAQNLWNPVILMWNHSTGTLVEGNTFINSDRAIAFGLFDNTGTDHSGGIIRNNFVYMQPGLYSSTRKAGSDGQIIVWDSPNTKVYHNTVIGSGNTNSSIEFRFGTAGGEVRNNLTDAPIGSRDGATFSQSGNYLTAAGSMFVDAGNANFHLVSNAATLANVIDKVAVLTGASTDWDGQTRAIGANADIGADEYQNTSNNAPVANDDTATTSEDTAVTVAVLANDSDPDGDPLTLSVVSVSNGSAVVDNNGTPTNPSDDRIRYTPNANFFGTGVVVYQISDGKGGTDTANLTVTVNSVNDAPVANDDTATTNEDVAVTVTVQSNDSDVDGDPLTLSIVSATNGTAVVDNNGTPSNLADDKVRFTPTANFFGTGTVVYGVADGKGGSDTATITLTVNSVNDIPVANDDTASTDEDVPVTVNVLSNDSDADGDPLTLSVVSASNGTAVVDDNGTPSNPSDDKIRFTPNADFLGTATVVYRASDGKGGSDTATITITVATVNDPPVANDDTATTNEDVAVTAGVLDNDSDADGDPLTLSIVSTGNGTAVVDDNGTPANPSDDRIRFTPNANFFGTGTVAYQISDGRGGTDTATLTVTVNSVNDAPVATDDSAATALNTPVTVTVRTNDTDVDGDTLTVTQVGQPAHGTAVLNGDGTVTYTPAAGYFGADAFTYDINDGQGGSDTGLVNVTVSDNGSVGLEDDPWNPGRTALVARGTDAADIIKFRKATNGTKIRVEFNGVVRGDFPVASISRRSLLGEGAMTS